MTPHADEDQHREAAVRRVVGIAALRKLRRMVDADAAQTASNRARARLVLTIILIAAALGLGFLLRNSIFG